MKFTIITILSVQLSDIKYIYIVAQLFPSSILTLCKTETSPLTITSHYPLLPVTGNQHSPLCLYNFDYFRDLI